MTPRPSNLIACIGEARMALAVLCREFDVDVSLDCTRGVVLAGVNLRGPGAVAALDSIGTPEITLLDGGCEHRAVEVAGFRVFVIVEPTP